MYNNNRSSQIPALPINKAQKRLYAASSDPTFEHDTYQAMQTYVDSDPTAYLGQILYCKANDTMYRISNDNGRKVLTETGIKGPKGDKGDVGPQGPKGEIPNMTEYDNRLDKIDEQLEDSLVFDVVLGDGSDTPPITTELTEQIKERVEFEAIEGNETTIPPMTTSQLMEEVNKIHKHLDEKVNTESLVYHVGITQKYKTITSAFNAWITDGRPKAIIYIHKGEYKEKIERIDSIDNLTFLGEDKYNTIWRYDKGYYKDCPCTMQGNNLIFRNITFLATSLNNPLYIYTDYVSGTNSGGAYALHIDHQNVEGHTIVEDCRLISNQNAALGCGTRTNQHIELINTECISYTPSNYTTVDFGAILWHSSNLNNNTGQKFSLKNCRVYNKNGRAMALKPYNTTVTVPLEFINNNFSSDVAKGDNLVVYLIKQGISLTNNSSGNNVNNCNATEGGLSPMNDMSLKSTTSTNDTVLNSYDIKANTVGIGNRFTIKIMGGKTGILETKVITLKVANTVIGTMTYEPSDSTDDGFFCEAEIGFQGGMLRCNCRIYKGINLVTMTNTTIDTQLTTDTKIELLGRSGGKEQIYENCFVVEPK